MRTKAAVFATALVLAILLGIPPIAGAQAAPPQVSTQNAVTVKVTPRLLEGAVWEFDVVFDTHSQDLNDDVAASAVLVASDGSELAPVEWSGPGPGGHHRAGRLRFTAPAAVPDPLVLRIRRAGEPEPRTFQWKLR